MDIQENNSQEAATKPPELVPPDAEPVTPRRGSLMLLLLVAFTIFIILDLAILAWFLLPGKTEKKQPPVQQKQEQSVKGPEKVQVIPKENTSGVVQTSMVGNRLRDRWLQLQAEAEADGINDWAGDSFGAIRETAAEADRLLDGHQNTKAAAKYQEATTALKSLQASRPALLTDALADGTRALAEGNGETAIKFFIRALALDPASDKARRGLDRAKNIDQIMALYAEAQAAQEKDELKAAEDILSRIRTLDREFQPAVSALVLVRAKLEEQAFNGAMAGFVQALTEKRSKAARAYLDRAEKLRPQSSMVRDGKKQLQQLAALQTLRRLQSQYGKAVTSENWAQARDICRQALQVDPRAAFAQAGLEKAKKRLALDTAMQAILDDPSRLQEKAVLVQARQTLAAARSVPDPGPQLSRRITKVDALLAVADKQVNVVLQSDNATEIVIYRVGKMGRFTRKTVHLRPGHYTVVGSRPGFRDVRREFEVRANDRQPQLTIRCTEVI